MPIKPPKPPVASAAQIAMDALLFLAEDPARFQRFVELTGLSVDDARANAGSAAFQAAVLGHVLADESLLLVFSAQTGHAAETVAPAEHSLQAEAGAP